MDLWQLVEEAVSPLGLDVLEVHFARGELLVRLERKDERPITVADLEEASRHIEAALDREDPIPGSYRLLVESPGPKRPLFTRRHFERFQGLKAKVPGPEGFTGRILRVEGRRWSSRWATRSGALGSAPSGPTWRSGPRSPGKGR